MGMKLTEQERLTLVEKKDHILKLTNEIIENIYSEPDVVLIKKNINAILAQLSIIASYTDSKSHKLSEFSAVTAQLTLSIQDYNNKYNWSRARTTIDVWCNMVNSIQFKFTERKALINLPNLDFNLLKQSLSGLKTGIDI